MITLLRLLMCLDLVAVGCEWFVPRLHWLLPLGGSHLAQLGMILIVAMFVAEAKAFRRHRASKRSPRRSTGPRKKPAAGLPRKRKSNLGAGNP